jgi:ADP-heptose:LPS heptosyltransferase
VITAPPGELPASLARRLDKLAGGPLICVHPTAGNAMKQWPVEYFASVLDRLVEADGAQIILIGAPGEEPVAEELLGGVRHPEAVISLVGKLPLAELPALLARASLFLGNDSGPKHIAAGLGVPTVGIHSGTVDVREWGPIGPNAVAVAREMVCSPCYLSNPEDCRRGLACLRQLSPETVYDACQRLLLLSAPAAASADPAEPPTRASNRSPRAGTRRSVRPARQSAAPLVAANPR